MNHYEWDGNEYVARKRSSDVDAAGQPMRWDDELRPEDWRRILLECLRSDTDHVLDLD